MSIEVMETTRTVVETSQVLKCDGCGAVCARVNGIDPRWPPETPDTWFCMRSGLWRSAPAQNALPSIHQSEYEIKHACSIDCARKVLSFEYAEVPL